MATAAAALAWRRDLGAWLQAHRSYPDEARREALQGRVVLRVTLDQDGTVRDVRLASGSGSGILDHAAMAMLEGAHLPAPPGGSVTLSLPVSYRLQP